MLRFAPRLLRPAVSTAGFSAFPARATPVAFFETGSQLQHFRGAKTKAGAESAASGKGGASKAKPKAEKPEKKTEKQAEPEAPAKEKKEKAVKAAAPAEGKERLLSPFAVFVRLGAEENKKSSNPVGFADLTKKLASQWAGLSDEQKKAYSGVKVVVKRKRQPSAFDLYKSEHLKNIVPSAQTFKQVTQDWKNLPASEKEKYQNQADQNSTPKTAHKRSAWQIYLSNYLLKLDQSQRSKENFKTNLQKAAAGFKSLGEEEKKKLLAQAS